MEPFNFDNEPVVHEFTSEHRALLKRNIARLATTTTETDAWIPADTYAQAVFMAMNAKRVLGSLAAALDVDIQKGRGDTVQVRVYPRRSAQGPITEGNSLVETASDALTTVPITIEAFGDFDVLTGQAIDQTSDNVKARLLTSMAHALDEKLEQQVYDNLATEASAQSVTLDTAGEIDYEEVLKAQAELKKTIRDGVNDRGPYKPDFLIISPEHEPDLLLDPALTKTVNYGPGEVALPGEIGKIGKIRVLVHELANAKDTALSAVNGVMIDSTRAFGEAYGKTLSFEEDRIAKSNKWEEVAWVFYGSAVIDPDAICHLQNAAA